MSADETILQAVRSWFKIAGPWPSAALTDAQVIVDDDKGPRPVAPYVVVKINAADGIVGFDERIDGITGGIPVVAIRGVRTATASIQGFGATAAGWLRNAAGTLELPVIDAFLRASGISLNPAGPMLDLSALISTAIESRHMREFGVVYGWDSPQESATDGTTEADFVEVEATLDSIPEDPDPIVNTTIITL